MGLSFQADGKLGKEYFLWRSRFFPDILCKSGAMQFYGTLDECQVSRGEGVKIVLLTFSTPEGPVAHEINQFLYPICQLFLYRDVIMCYFCTSLLAVRLFV